MARQILAAWVTRWSFKTKSTTLMRILLRSIWLCKKITGWCTWHLPAQSALRQVPRIQVSPTSGCFDQVITTGLMTFSGRNLSMQFHISPLSGLWILFKRTIRILIFPEQLRGLNACCLPMLYSMEFHPGSMWSNWRIRRAKIYGSIFPSQRAMTMLKVSRSSWKRICMMKQRFILNTVTKYGMPDLRSMHTTWLRPKLKCSKKQVEVNPLH